MADINLGGSIGTTGTAILGRANIVIPSDADYVLLVSEYTNQYLYVTSSVPLTATRNIIVPVAKGVEYVVFNGTTGSQSIQIIGTFGGGVNIPTQQTVSVVCDGSQMVSLGGVVSGISGSIVFQPGGSIVAPNYFSSETALQTATSAIVGPKSIYFDFSQNSDTYTVAGDLNFGNETTWVGLIDQNTAVPTLNTAFQILNTPDVIRDLNTNFTFVGTVFTPTPVNLKIIGRSFTTCGPGTNLYTVNGGGIRLLLDTGASLGDNVNPCITVTSGNFLLYMGVNSVLTANAILLSGGTLTIFPEMGAIIDGSFYQAPGVTIQGITYGTSSLANGANSLTVGNSCGAFGANTIAMGSGGLASLDDMIAIGGATGIRTQNSGAIGVSSVPFVTPTNQEFITATDTSYMWTVRIVAQDITGAGNLAAWEYKVTGKNTAGTLVLQDTGTLIYSSLGGNTWTITFSVFSSNIFRFTFDGTNGGQQVIAAATVEWTRVP